MSGHASMAPKSVRKLPSGWRWVKLGEVLDIADSGVWGEPNIETGISVLRSTNFRNDGTFNFSNLALREIPHNKRQSKILFEGDIVLERSGGGPLQPVGRVCYYEGDKMLHAFGNFCQRLRARNDRCNPRYLFWYLHLFHISGHTQFFQKQTTGIRNLEYKRYLSQEIPLPPLPEQKRIVAILNEQMSAVDRACKAAEEQLNASSLYPFALVRESLKSARKQHMALGDCLDEVRTGIGAKWSEFPVLGATRQGLALAKDPVGKTPERYKPVTSGTVFYNPMRILLGSIAMVDEGDEAGITSPDYVVVRGKEGILDSRWFYYWFRSPYGAHLIDSLSRGAVRERILFNRLAEGMIDLPPIDVQKEASAKMRMVAGIKRALDEQLATINRMPAALLRRAFNGEI